MKKPILVLKSIQSYIVLGLLSLFLVILISPGKAQYNFQFSSGKFQLEMLKNEHKNDGSNLIEQGRNLYEAGRLAEAVAIWEQAAKSFNLQGDILNQSLSLNYLSNAYQELGEWEQAKNAIAQSLALLQTHPNPTILAQALNTQGSLQLAMGQTEAALDTWKQAEKTYQKLNDQNGILGSLINQAAAWQTLGLYRQAKATLEQVNKQLQQAPNSLLKATGLRSLGVALQVVGDLTNSQQVLSESLAIAQQLNSPADISAAFFSLANTMRSLGKPEEAFKLYQEAAKNAQTPLLNLEAKLNQFSLLVDTKQWTAAQAFWPPIQTELANLSASRSAIYAQVNFVQTMVRLNHGETKNEQFKPIPNYQDIAQLLAKALQQAKLLKDSRAESYALGELGLIYKETQQLETAAQLTKQALIIAQGISASDIVARWQEQLGDILKQQGDINGAIAAYSEAVNSLQSLRSDLVAINPDVQFSFRETVEPVYRQLVALLLQSNPNQKNIKQARQVIEALQLAELDNFFREACLDAKPEQIDKIDPTAAVIYPIILPDRLAVILSFANQPLTYYQTALPQENVEKTIDSLLEALNPFYASEERLRFSQQIYDWLIRPAEAKLAENKIKTLIFVPDGSLRNLPMAALYDGKQYLIEKYSIALTPGLQLLAPRSLSQQKMRVLTAGLTEGRQGFSPLPGVKLEVEQIASEVPAQVFLDQQFTEKNLQNQIAATSFPIVHLATHGQFSSNPEQTFILTWDEKIKVKEFEELLRSRQEGRENPIELLVLSACQTAAGDKRAALGLAGVAVRSGARSTLATLWSVKDESTAKLMTEFYQHLYQGVRKADALRIAQLSLLKQPKYAHPFYWAPFILVGNWL